VLAFDETGAAHPADLSGGASLLVAEADADEAAALLAQHG
jgi:hypothetical protein